MENEKNYYATENRVPPKIGGLDRSIPSICLIDGAVAHDLASQKGCVAKFEIS
jgi:hypothetical protein